MVFPSITKLHLIIYFLATNNINKLNLYLIFKYYIKQNKINRLYFKKCISLKLFFHILNSIKLNIIKIVVILIKII